MDAGVSNVAGRTELVCALVVPNFINIDYVYWGCEDNIIGRSYKPGRI